MSDTLDIPLELSNRVRAIAARTNLTPSQVIADALENGHSLEWQENFIAQIEAAIAEADRGEFATEDEIRQVREKYRPS